MPEQKIPAIIHYCWFGRGPKSALFEKCLESWKRHMPECRIIEWNEDNTDLSANNFIKGAYAAKKWAFVSDYTRFKVLYEYGGIYLDTDVELKESWSHFMTAESFFFFQNHDQINTGQGFGAVKGNEVIKRMLDCYDHLEFVRDSTITSPRLNTGAVTGWETFHPNGETQNIRGNLFICAEDYWKTAYHYGEFSWMDEAHRQALRFAKKKHGAWKIKKFFRNPKIYEFLNNHHLGGVSRIYTFLIYDFIDYGFLYWVVRGWQKLTGKG